MTPFRFDFPLGRIPRDPKPTDFPFSALGQAAATPAVWKPSDAINIPITMQGTEPACGGFSAQYSLVLKLYRALVASGQAGQYLPLGPRSAYAAEKLIDGVGLNVAGTTIEAIAKMRQAYGIALEVLFPSDTTLPQSTYGNYALMSPQAKQDALARATGESYFFLGPRPPLQTLKDAIYQYGDVILEVDLGQEWYTAPNGQTSWNAPDILPLRPPQKTVSGHFIDCTAFDDTIWFPNSWSEEWGVKGWGNFGANYVPYIVNGVVFKKVPPSVKQTLTAQQFSLAQTILQDIEEALGLISKEVGQGLAKVAS